MMDIPRSSSEAQKSIKIRITMALNTSKPKYILVSLALLSGVILTGAYAKIPAIVELEKTGFYGRVHAWQNKAQTGHNVEVKVPSNAPIIISDYHSNVGANGLKRTGMHRGVDLFADIGSPVIAAADGRVISAKVDKCWGPTMLISHGKDKKGRPLYGLYGHVRNFKVTVGQKVKRGQQIAEMGEDIFTTCGAGFHHLHFQVSHVPGSIPFGWGWASFVSDGHSAPNPHKYWEGGEGKITCFKEGEKYSKGGLTYPLPCKASDEPKHSPQPPVQLAVEDKTMTDTELLTAIDLLFAESEDENRY